MCKCKIKIGALFMTHALYTILCKKTFVCLGKLFRGNVKIQNETILNCKTGCNWELNWIGFSAKYN